MPETPDVTIMEEARSSNLGRLKIALCIWMFKPGTGGLQAHAENLARHLISKGHEVKVLTRSYACVPENLGFLTYREGQFEAEVGGIPVRALHYPEAMSRWARIIAKLREYPLLWRISVALFRRITRPVVNEFEGFDLIHYVGQADQMFGFAAADAAAHHRVPFLVQPTCHPHVVGDRPMDLALYRMADRILVHTRYEEEYLRGKLSEVPFDVVGNGIDDRSDGNGERFRSLHGISGHLILYIGRRDKDKGYGLVTDAFQKLRDRRGDVTLVCMGPPGALSKVDATGIIHYDFADESTKHDALAACTCLCVPSEGESFGLVYMEAGRYSKPVIARSLPVLEELLENGKAGMLVGDANPDKNSTNLTPQNLVNSLQRLLSAPDLCKKIGMECERVSDRFIWGRVIKKFEAAYIATLNHDVQD